MFGRPELIFKVKLKTYGEIRDDTLELPLIFFSAFESVALESDDKMRRMGIIIQLYKSGPFSALEPIMHVGFLSHVLCRVPLIPCFMDGSDHPTILRRFARSTKINRGRANRQPGTGNGSKLYEVNMWMWNCGRGMQRPTTVSESEQIRASHAAISRTKQHATRKRNRKDQ
jgi:hypothetical protein